MKQTHRNIAKFSLISIILLLTAVYILLWHENRTIENISNSSHESRIISLTKPRTDSEISIEESLMMRRSIRKYSNESLGFQELSQLLWAAQGITSTNGLRTAPSAGALYPLEVYVVVGNVEGLTSGVYRYLPKTHSISKILDGDKRKELAWVSLNQSCIKEAAIDIVVVAVYERTTEKYGERGIRYVHIEAGHAAQNLCLQATAIKLGIVTIGAFDDINVSSTLNLPQNEKPLYIIPIGKIHNN